MTYPLSAARVSRRSVLKGALLTGSAAAVSPLLAACGGDSSSGTRGGTGSDDAVALPTYKPIEGLTPDLPGGDLVQPGFFKYPSKLFDSVQNPPLSGGEVTALVISYAPPPPQLGNNPYWQAVNDEIGAEIQTTPTPEADYASKLATVTSGSEVPDLVLFPTFMPVNRFTELLGSRFADLSDHLSGDAVLNYPNLANVPTYAWPNARVAGRIYGVPVERPAFYSPLFYRADLFTQLDLDWGSGADDFLTLAVELTDESASRWALGSISGRLNLRSFLSMFGVPNNWRQESDGTLGRDLETEEFTEAVAFMRKLWEAGVYHPDAATMNVAQAKDALAAGRVAMLEDGLAAWPAYYQAYRGDNPDLRIGAWVPSAHDGGDGQFYLDKGAFGIVAIKQGDNARVEELLRALDFFSAPFGSSEELLLRRGLEGVTFDFDSKGAPVINEAFAEQSATGFQYLGTGPGVLFDPAYPDRVEDQYAWEEKVAAIGVADPTVGLFSNAYGRVGATLDKLVSDTVLAVVTGRSPVDDLANLAKEWKRGGGDEIRDEYEEALA